MTLWRFACLVLISAFVQQAHAAFPFSFGGVNDSDPGEAVSISGGEDDIFDSVVTPNDDLLLVGEYTGEVVDFSPHNSAVDVTRSSTLSAGAYYSSGFLASYSGVTSQLMWVANGITTCAEDDKWWGVDASSTHIYVVGEFCGTTTITDGLGATTSIQTSDDIASPGDASDDIFVAKLNFQGGLVWIKTLGGAQGTDKPDAVAADPAGNVFVGGQFKGTVDFDPGAGTANLTADADESVSNQDAFVVSLDANGEYRWAKRLGGDNDEDWVERLEADANYVYVAAELESDIDGVHMDDNNADSEFDARANGGSDGSGAASNEDFVVIQRLNSADGSVSWSSVFLPTSASSSGAGGGIEDIDVMDIAIDSSGAVYLAGFFQHTLDVDPARDNAVSLTVLGDRNDKDGYVIKLDASGDLVWATAIGQANSLDSADALVVTSGANASVYVTGDFENTIDADGRGVSGAGGGAETLTSAGNDDVFILQLNSSGVLVWAEAIGGAYYDTGDALARDSNNNIYVSGKYKGTSDIDPTDAVLEVSTEDFLQEQSTDGTDLFVAKLSSAGAPVPADSDNDGVDDNQEVLAGTNPNDDDSDNDGTVDGSDAFPLDPKETTDTDGDGVGDNRDAFPNDPTRSVMPVPTVPLPWLVLLIVCIGSLGRRWLQPKSCQ